MMLFMYNASSAIHASQQLASLICFIFETSAAVLCGTTGVYIYIYIYFLIY